jgi:hypothetical protein
MSHVLDVLEATDNQLLEFAWPWQHAKTPYEPEGSDEFKHIHKTLTGIGYQHYTHEGGHGYISPDSNTRRAARGIRRAWRLVMLTCWPISARWA